MTTNPGNAVGTNAAYGGRTSVNAFNDDLAPYSRGVLSGWACAPNGGMKVALGGNSGVRDVAVAEDNAGNKVTINNISGSAVEATIGTAPASNSRIDAIVAYVDNPPQGSSTIADNYEACGLITVAGTASSSPIKPTDGAIRTAITADGASGATAYYVILAYVTVQAGTTDLTSNDISVGQVAGIKSDNIDFTTINGTQLGSILSRATAGSRASMIINDTYNIDFNGFISFVTYFNNTDGYLKYIIMDENNNTVFEYQQNSGPKADYSHYTPIYPVKSGWKYKGENTGTHHVQSLAMLPVVIS